MIMVLGCSSPQPINQEMYENYVTIDSNIVSLDITDAKQVTMNGRTTSLQVIGDGTTVYMNARATGVTAQTVYIMRGFEPCATSIQADTVIYVDY